MPKKETKRSRSRGSLKSSTVNQKSTQNSTKTMKISKFFTKETSGSSDFSDSPYKNCQNNVKSVNYESDLDDFKTPKAINKVSKLAQNPKETKRKSKKSVQVPLRNFLQDNFKHVDVNPDHLQMALALSESEQAFSQEKNESFKKAFEKFGFGYSKSRAPVESKREAPKNKKSRYRYVTPIIKIRTQEEREALISSRVSLILAQNQRNSIENCPKEAEPQVSSKFLRKYVGRTRIMQLHRLELEKLNKEGVFYVAGLGIEVSPASCGCLLKDWRRIPGREPTPERGATSKTQKGGGGFINEEQRENDTSISGDFHQPENGDTEFQNGDCREISPYLDTSQPETSSSAHFIGEKVEGTSGSCDKITSPCLELPDIQLPDFSKTSNSSAKLGESFGEMNSKSLNSPSESPHKVKSPVKTFDKISSPNESFHKLTSPSGSYYELTSPSGSFDKIISPSGKFTLPKKPSKYELSPPGSPVGEYLETSKDDTIIITPYKSNTRTSLVQGAPKSEVSFTLTPPKNNTVCSPSSVKTPSPQKSNKRSFQCLSPDLFDDEDYQSPVFVKSPIFNNSRLASSSTAEEMECYDLTQSDDEEKSFHLNVSCPEDSVDQRSDLNVTDYVRNLLTGQEPPSGSKLEKISTSEDDSQESQSSIYISDDELNYSSVFATPPPRNEKEEENLQYEEYRITSPVVELLSLEERIKAKSAKLKLTSQHDDVRKEKEEKENLQYEDNRISPIMEGRGDDSVNKTSHHLLYDTLNVASEQISSTETPNKPDNRNFIIKTSNITPMANYDQMDTPKIVKELDKFGLKPLKRQKGAKLLKYIYESTHPIVQDENGKVLKKRRTKLEYPQDGGVIIGDVGETDELIFEKTQSKKISSCRVPLHIVWYNLVMSNPKIRENILLYEPLQLEILHSMIKEQGYKFNIQDLLQFLDKKCITIRTAQGQHQSGKKQKRI